MKVFVFALLVGAAVAAAPVAIAPRGGSVIPNEWIITTQPSEVNAMSMSALEASIESIIAATNGEILHKYNHATKGFAIRTNEHGLKLLRNMNGVSIEANLRVHAVDCQTEREATWGLVRVSEHLLKLDGQYFFGDTAGEGVTSYIIDTGIQIDNEEFEGRASWGFDVESPATKKDGNGHGTHVAGTVIGKTYGIAKKATAIAVKVLGTDGSGTTAGVIAGIDWVAEHHAKNGKPSTANMSLGGGYSSAMNKAVDALIKSGVALAVAAGNENQDACNVSPASAESVFTVGATDDKDARAYFSNYGKCVDAFAPGVQITSAWIGAKTATKTISGTSMASPHVAGVLTRYRAAHPEATVEEAFQHVLDTATKDVVTDVRGSPNLLLYAACEY